MNNARALKDYRVRPIWIPVLNAGWRDCPNDAWDDAARDYDLRQGELHLGKEGN